MGCKEIGDKDFPVLICFFEPNNDQQKEYCLKLKDNFQHEKSIRYEIRSTADNKFAIQLKIKDKTHDIQTEFTDTEEEMKIALDKMYKILNEIK